MNFLILGGTAWLGREVATLALSRGHAVTCLARGISGPVAEGSTLVVADRSDASAYDDVKHTMWDEVVDVSWDPGFVRHAVAALGDRATHWTYVSSCSVYADTATVGADETAATVEPMAADKATDDMYEAAKVACERATTSAMAGRLLIARPGLIGGPGDTSGRSGYWVARAARDPQGPMLVPDSADSATQVVDARDLAAWFVLCAEARVTGTFNAVGPIEPFGKWVNVCRSIGHHTGRVVVADPAWLLDQGVRQYMGPESLPMWIADPGLQAFTTRSGAAATAAGLTHRPREDLIADVLNWEREQGLDRVREAGLTADYERTLIAAYPTR